MLTEREKSELDERGFVLFEDVIMPEEIDELRELSLSLAEKDRALGREWAHRPTVGSQRVWNLVNKGEPFERAIQHPRILAAMEYLLGASCTLSSFTANLIKAGGIDSSMHVDQHIPQLPTPRPAFPIVANSIWFLDDFTLENGATRVVPGSHRRLVELPECDARYDGEARLTGPKGSVAVMSGALWHAAAPNRTDRVRVGLLGFFCRAIIKPQQDHSRLISGEVIARATPTLKRLLGFDSMPSLND